MEKYAVEEVVELPKTAAEQPSKPLCPACGGVLRPRDMTGILLCPDCGSRPFEGT